MVFIVLPTVAVVFIVLPTVAHTERITIYPVYTNTKCHVICHGINLNIVIIGILAYKSRFAVLPDA